jgi:beta-mannosidase
MHNESPQALDWIGKKNKDQNLALDNALAQETRRLDPVRVVHRDSGTGDGHVYNGWFYGDIVDLLQPPKQPFITEYGAGGLPNVETLRSIFPPEHLWPQTEQDWEHWKYADFDYPSTFERLHIQQGKNIEEFVKNSQRYQANFIRYATESFRRYKWTKTTGIYHFMFTDEWPSVHFSVVDYYRRPKLGYTALKTAMQPLLPSIEYNIRDPKQPLTLYVINDYWQTFKGTSLNWQLVSAADNNLLAGQLSHRVSIDIAEDSVQKITEIPTPPEIVTGKAFLKVWIEENSGKILGENTLSQDNFLNQ